MSIQGGGLERMEDFLQADSLISEYRFFIERYESLSEIEARVRCVPKLELLCVKLSKKTDAMKAITKMYTASHIEFDRALFCSWFSLLQARALGLDERHQETLFFAGLLQDIGKYAVDGSVSTFIRKMSGAKMPAHGRHDLDDSHPLLSSSFIERHFPDDIALSELVLHHHASADGTGYPHYVVESQLGLDDQLLIIANEIADRVDVFGSYDDIQLSLPFLKIAGLLYFTRTHQSCYRLLRSCLPQQRVTNFTAQAIESRVATNHRFAQSLKSCIEALVGFSGELVRYDFDLVVRGIRANIERLVFLGNETGVLADGAFAVGSEVLERELLEVDDIFTALPESLARFERYLSHLLAEQKYDVDRNLLDAVLVEVGSCIKNISPQRSFLLR